MNHTTHRAAIICLSLAVPLLFAPPLAADPTNSDAVGSETAERRSRYCLRIALVQREWQAGNLVRARELLESTDPDLRDWAYKYLHHRLHGELHAWEAVRPMIGNTRLGVRHVVFSPDGERLAIAGDDLHVRTYDVASRNKLLDFHQETRTVDFSPDSQQLVAGLSHSVSLLDADSGRALRHMTLNSAVSGKPLRVQFGSQGKYVAAADSQRGVRLWDVRSSQSVHYIEDVDSSAFCLSPDGRTLAVVKRTFQAEAHSPDYQLLLHDVATGRRQSEPSFAVPNPVTNVTDLVFSPNGHYLAVACSSAIYLFKVETGAIRQTFATHAGHPTCVRFNPDGSQLACGGTDGTLHLWNLRSGRLRFRWSGHTAPVRSVAFHPTGSILASGGADGMVKLWDAVFEPAEFVIDPTAKPYSNRPVISGGGKFLALPHRHFADGKLEGTTVQVMSSLTGRELSDGDIGDQQPIQNLTISRDGRRLALVLGQAPPRTLRPTKKAERGSSDLCVWNVQKQRRLTEFSKEAPVDRMALSGDGHRLFVVSHEAIKPANNPGKTRIDLDVFAAETGKCLHSESVRVDGRAEPTGLRISADETFLAVGLSRTKMVNRWEGAILLFDGKTGKRIRVIDEPRGVVMNVDFSPDGRRLAAAVLQRKRETQGHIEIRDRASGKRTLSIPAHPNGITHVAFTPDGHLIVSSGTRRSERSEAKVWDADAGQQVLHWRHPPVAEMTFHTETDNLVLIHTNGKMRMLEATPPTASQRNERAETRNRSR